MIPETVSPFMQGMVAFAYLTAALFLFRFWRDSRDRLFVLFGIAFVILGLNRIALQFFGSDEEVRTLLYIVRLSAFIILLVAIIDKNWPRRENNLRPHLDKQADT